MSVTVAGRLLVLRADAGPSVGMGHVMRGLALAQAWQDAGGRCAFAMQAGASTVAGRLRDEGMSLLPLAPSGDAEATARCAVDAGAAFVVVDGYGFSVAYQAALAAAGVRCLVIDDDGVAGRYVAPLVLDQNVFAEEARYLDRTPGTRLLLGPRYALLRREFLARPQRSRPVGPSKRILGSFGGADPAGLTELLLEALRSLGPDLEATLLVGAANPRRAAIEALAARPGTRVLYDAPNVPELMAESDLAVVAAGSTCLELAYMALPALAIVTATNQERVAERFDALGTLRSLGDAKAIAAGALANAVRELLDDEQTRARMALEGPRLVDGRGAARVVAAMEELAP